MREAPKRNWRDAAPKAAPGWRKDGPGRGNQARKGNSRWAKGGGRHHHHRMSHRHGWAHRGWGRAQGRRGAAPHSRFQGRGFEGWRHHGRQGYGGMRGGMRGGPRGGMMSPGWGRFPGFMGRGWGMRGGPGMMGRFGPPGMGGRMPFPMGPMGRMGPMGGWGRSEREAPSRGERGPWRPAPPTAKQPEKPAPSKPGSEAGRMAEIEKKLDRIATELDNLRRELRRSN